MGPAGGVVVRFAHPKEVGRWPYPQEPSRIISKLWGLRTEWKLLGWAAVQSLISMAPRLKLFLSVGTAVLRIAYSRHCVRLDAVLGTEVSSVLSNLANWWKLIPWRWNWKRKQYSQACQDFITCTTSTSKVCFFKSTQSTCSQPPPPFLRMAGGLAPAWGKESCLGCLLLTSGPWAGGSGRWSGTVMLVAANATLKNRTEILIFP